MSNRGRFKRYDSEGHNPERERAADQPTIQSEEARRADVVRAAGCPGLSLLLESPTMNDIPKNFTLSVVVPVYNEERTLGKLVATVKAVPMRKQQAFFQQDRFGFEPEITSRVTRAGVWQGARR